MAVTINASTTAGLVQTADTSGVLALQSAGTTAVTISAAQVATFAQAPVLPAASIPQAALAAGVAGTGPAFRAYNATGTVTLPGNTETKITFDTENFDTNGNFASSRFTSTVAGYYQVNGAITVNFWNGNILAVSIYKNGSVYARGNTGYPQTVGGVRVNVGDIVYLNGSTDYIELYGYQYNQSTNNVTATGSDQTYFSAALVRAA